MVLTSPHDAAARSARQATPEAIEELVRLRGNDFLRVASAIAGSDDAGRDSVQEALARTFAARAGFRGTGTLEAWLWRAVVNAARNTRSRTPRVAELKDEAAAAGDDLERRAVVRAAVAGLPERQRLALFLRYYADLDYATIGRILRVRRGTVSATLNHAHAALRRSLDEEVLS